MRELVDSAHVGEDRAIMRHHEGTNLGLTRGLVLLALELRDQLKLIADAHVGVGLSARCWSFVQPALSRLRSVVRRGVRLLPGLLIVDLDRMRPSG